VNSLSEIIRIKKYKSIIFDFDGVIIDSNNIKKNAIQKAASSVLSDTDLINFVSYFVRYNGVPRGEKIKKFVDDSNVNMVLERYEKILDYELDNAPLISGVKDFIINISSLDDSDTKLYVLSGGEVSEINNLLDRHQIKEYFHEVYAAPNRKEDNLIEMKIDSPTLFFGDSLVDYRVSREFNLDFVFVYGATSVLEWKSQIDQDVLIASIKDFKDL